jgi:predicted NodU family carbamoyl transferase
MVTNTSFNLADEPIVCSATDAARTLARSEGLDVVFAGGLALSKSHTVLEAVLGHCEPVTT